MRSFLLAAGFLVGSAVSAMAASVQIDVAFDQTELRTLSVTDPIFSFDIEDGTTLQTFVSVSGGTTASIEAMDGSYRIDTTATLTVSVDGETQIFSGFDAELQMRSNPNGSLAGCTGCFAGFAGLDLSPNLFIEFSSGTLELASLFSRSSNRGGGANDFFLQTRFQEAEVVPLPASILLLGAGLAGLGAFGRRRRTLT